MVVLWWVGGLADRVNRGRLLCLASTLAIAVVGIVLATNLAFPRLAATGLLVFGKQVGGALELLLWVVIADRFTAREARRLLPWVVVANGTGAVLGAISVGPLSLAIGAMGPLWAALGVLALVLASAILLLRAPDQRVALGFYRGHLKRASKGVSSLWQRPLAKWLAILVASAGVFAPIMYYLLGVRAAAEYTNEVELAGFFGQFRAYVQIAALIAQIAIAPWLSRRLGIGVLLILAPLGAIIVSLCVGLRSEFVWIYLAQAITRILDNAIQNPAEQLIQNLLPQNIRGRVAGFVGGVAKRSGAIVGGLAASLFIVNPSLFAFILTFSAGLWMLIALHLWRHFSEYAVLELANSDKHQPSHELALRFASDRDLANLRKRLRSTDSREQANALALLGRLGAYGKVDAMEELFDALTRCIKGAPALRMALRLRLGDGDTVLPALRVRAIRLLDSEQEAERELAMEILGCAECTAKEEERLRTAAESSHSLAAQLVFVRADKGSILPTLLGEEQSGSLVHQLRYEIVRASAHSSADNSEDLAERLLRIIASCPIPDLQVAGLNSVLLAVGDAGDSALSILLRGRLSDLSHRWRHNPVPALREASLLALQSAESVDYHPWIHALADREEAVRRRAESLLREAGDEALAALATASQSGKRRIRLAAVDILADLRPSAQTLDALLDREIEEMARCSQCAVAFVALDRSELVRRRLAERIDESLEAALMILEVRMDNPGVGEVARRLARASGERSRSRALEALDTLLPWRISRTILGAMEGTLPEAGTLAESIDLQLTSRDSLTRDLLLYAMDGNARSSFRKSIGSAASTAASAMDATALVKRIVADGRDTIALDVPTTLETIVALSELPLFEDLTTIQLEELAKVVDWVSLGEGETLMEQGEEATCMYFVRQGELRVQVDGQNVATLGQGEPVGEMGLFAQDQRSGRVLALVDTQLGRITREALENLIEEVPGVALRLCRAMSRRLVVANTNAS